MHHFRRPHQMTRLIAILFLTASAALAATNNCTFTAADNTLLEDYAVGAELTWTENTGFSTGNIQVSDANRGQCTTTATAVYYVDNFTPANYNYDVEMTVRFVTLPTTNQTYLGPIGRATSTSAASGYVLWLARDSGTWEINLDRYGGANLATANITTPTAGNDYQMKLEMRDNVIRGYWDGTLVVTAVINSTSANYLSSVGMPALYMDMPGTALTDSTGLHVDDYTVTDAPAINTTGTQTPASTDFWYNSRTGTSTGTYVPEQSCYAELRFTTNAQKMFVTGWTNGNAVITDTFVIWINGVQAPTTTYAHLDFPDNGDETFTVFFVDSPGTSKEIRIQNSMSTYSGGQVNRSYITSVELLDYYNTPTYTLSSPERPELLIYGDSIMTGASVSNPGGNSACIKLRRLYGRKVAVDGWGGRALSQDGSTAGDRTTLATVITRTQPLQIWMQVATNDYGAVAAWNATDFGTAYADLLDKIHTADPNITIWCQSPTQRISPFDETANAFGDTTAAYRTAIQTAAAARTYCRYVDGAAGAIIPNKYFSDGLHADATGQHHYADFIHGMVWGARVNTGGSNAVIVTGGQNTIRK
jgi:lysophospholipase L1-like esterase